MRNFKLSLECAGKESEPRGRFETLEDAENYMQEEYWERTDIVDFIRRGAYYIVKQLDNEGDIVDEFVYSFAKIHSRVDKD